MTSRASQILLQGRNERIFSAAAWSHGDSKGAWDRGVIGTLSWDGPDARTDSYWDLASVSKAIVAVAILALVDRGVMTLDDTVGDFLPEYPLEKSRISVRQLLTHTSGFPGQVPMYREHPTREQFVEALRRLPMRSLADTEVKYSSQGFIVLGFIAEAATGKPLDVLVSELVFAPTGMSESRFDLDQAQRERAVSTECDPWRRRVIQGEVHDENAAVLGRPAGHAGVFSTLVDMEAFAQALCARGTGDYGRILSTAAYRAMTEPQTDHLNARWALGWTIAGEHEHGANAGDLISSHGFGHTGFTGTSLWIDPETGRYSLLLTNRIHPSRENTGISRIRSLVNNVAFGAPPSSLSQDMN